MLKTIAIPKIRICYALSAASRRLANLTLWDTLYTNIINIAKISCWDGTEALFTEVFNYYIIKSCLTLAWTCYNIEIKVYPDQRAWIETLFIIQ